MIPALTGARFFAAFAVLLCHFTVISGFVPSSPIYFFRAPAVQFGMTLFFTLSGFVLFLNYAPLFNERPWREATRIFFVARFARLYPLYAFLLFVMVLWDPWKVSVDAVLYLPLLQSWSPIGFGGFPPFAIALMHHSWSISTEFFFYLLFPAIALSLLWYLRKGNAFILAAVVFVLSIAISYAAYSLAERYLLDGLAGPARVVRLFWLAFYSPYVRVFEFLLGCVAAACLMSFGRAQVGTAELRWGRRIQTATLLIVFAMTVMRASREVALGWELNNFADFFAYNYLYAGPFAVLLFCISRYETSLSQFLSLPLIVLGGEISYSIYMLHVPMLLFFAVKSPPIDPTAMDYLLFACRCLALAGFTFVISYGTYSLIEQPARKRIRAWFDQMREARPRPDLGGEARKAFDRL